MDNAEIPVLTKVVQKASPPAVDVDELVAQVRQLLLPEIAEIVTSQLGQRAFERTVVEQQALTEYAESLQQGLSRQVQSQVGDSIQSIEEAFREAMSHVGKQQLQSVEAEVSRFTGTQQLEETLTQLMDDQQAHIAARVEQMQAQLEQHMTEHMQQLQESSKQTLTAGQEAMESRLIEEHRQSLQDAFAEFTGQQTEEFRLKLNAELAAVEAVLQEKVQAMVNAQMQEIEAALNKRLKSSILEVLQGIKFVMPSV